MGAHISYAAVKCLEWQKVGVVDLGLLTAPRLEPLTLVWQGEGGGAANGEGVPPPATKWAMRNCATSGRDLWLNFKITPKGRRHNFHDHNSPAGWQPSGILITSFRF